MHTSCYNVLLKKELPRPTEKLCVYFPYSICWLWLQDTVKAFVPRVGAEDYIHSNTKQDAFKGFSPLHLACWSSNKSGYAVIPSSTAGIFSGVALTALAFAVSSPAGSKHSGICSKDYPAGHIITPQQVVRMPGHVWAELLPLSS